MQSLTGFFGRHRRLLIGVDISDTQVRVVSLSKQAGRYRVEGYCIGELADGAVEDGVIGDVDTVALCLERLVERMGLRTHGAALAIKSGAAFTKHVMLDSTLARREIEELMLVEAESSLPYALDEVYLDYAIADGVEETAMSESKTPFLGDIPYLGRLFKRTKRSSRRTELLIFITPKIFEENFE